MICFHLTVTLWKVNDQIHCTDSMQATSLHQLGMAAESVGAAGFQC